MSGDRLAELKGWRASGAHVRVMDVDWLIAEVERLRAGGCARDQGLTQFCAEAVALQGHLAAAATAYEAVLLREQRANARIAALEAVLAEPEGDALVRLIDAAWEGDDPEYLEGVHWPGVVRGVLAELRKLAGVPRG